MALEPIEPQPGSDRDPANFVGRTAITSQARKRLQVGANLLLTDPRRMGKTFWMHTFAAREKRFHTSYSPTFSAPSTGKKTMLFRLS